jgi:hypothetical protein
VVEEEEVSYDFVFFQKLFHFHDNMLPELMLAQKKKGLRVFLSQRDVLKAY